MERLKHKRAARRAQVTKLIIEVTELRGDPTVSKTTLNGLLARLVASDSDLRKTNDEIEPLIKDDDLAAEYESIIAYEEQAANAVAEVQTRLGELQLTEMTSPATTPQVPATCPLGNQQTQSSGVKLPKLQLLTFTGELTQWLPFWEQFRTAVHENGKLTKTEKFQYLSTLLKGQAASAIRGLQATESCYDDAIEILTQRFGDTGRIERDYLTRLRNLPAVKSSADVSGLRTLYDHVQANVRGLRALGVSSATYASMMVDILLSSLPGDMVVEYRRMTRYGTALSDVDGVTENDAASRQSESSTRTESKESASNSIRKGKVVELCLRSQYHPKDYVIHATTIPFICKDLAATQANHDFVESIRRRGDIIADDVLFPNVTSEVGIGVLIGCDEMWKLLTGDVTRCEENDSLVAVGTVFGWTFQGPAAVTSYCTEQTTTAICVLRVGVAAAEPEPDILTRFWDLESIGISDEPKSKVEHNASVLEEFERNIQVRDGRYEVGLPWKTRPDDLYDNYQVAKNRLQSLARRLNRDDSIEEYDAVIRNYLKGGHAEKVTGDGAGSTAVYYMPHRAVIRSESTSTKIRVVFDASSHAPGATSLNYHLEKGPKLNTDLVPILLRFRMHKIAMTADIQKAFLQIGIRECDRDALRFLWFSEAPASNEHQPEIECWRMTRVPFGTTASPFLLGATLQHHLSAFEETHRELARKLMDPFYVDDLLIGASTVNEAREIARSSQDVLRQAGMNLTKWTSNSTELQGIFEHENNSRSEEEKSFGEPTETKVLGVVWDRNSDHLKFSADHLLCVIIDMTDTKRSVLQASARIFDPLGFLAPYTIRVKIIFQELWKAGLKWDDSLPSDLSKMWRSRCSELPNLRNISLERCLLPASGSQYSHELHIFTDASPHAYGACAFLRTTSESGETKVQLFAKSRVAPLKKLTLPRLELMGALIGVRIAKILKTSLTMVTLEPQFWTDSTITLSWIKRDANRWKPFVRNRVAEIQECSERSQWRHCPGADNPADALTRGMSVKALIEDERWFQGPTWLSGTEESWPRAFGEDDEGLNGAQDEMIKATTLVALVDKTIPAPALLNLSKYSNYQRPLRVTAWIKRFVKNCRSDSRLCGPLTATELDDAEMFWARHAQWESFPEEMLALKHGDKIAATSKIVRLQPFLDDKEVMRLSGRLQSSDNPEQIKYPILLTKEHPLSELIAQNAHMRALHGGVQTTLTVLREKWWITRARQLVKSTMRSCKVCARFRAIRATAPTAPLPADRTNPTHPFDITGVDFAGPVYIKNARGSPKSYIALFTCATTRAVHLELVADLTTKSFIMAFRRFISRRGAPSTIYSDNALTFKKAARDLGKLWNIIRSTDSQDFAATNRIKWKFIVESCLVGRHVGKNGADSE
ncbi:uncharacterized protein LOC135384731 [Ornithodoros turicata]|uniref:uncharacterized protein LOC135384731 n=1 Tax=Ornithodoros turicata TaxID=34597 RepID=UPI003139491F